MSVVFSTGEKTIWQLIDYLFIFSLGPKIGAVKKTTPCPVPGEKNHYPFSGPPAGQTPGQPGPIPTQNVKETCVSLRFLGILE